MHLLMPKPSNTFVPIFFNVDAAVGNQGANATEDVLLVQFLLRKSAGAAGLSASRKTRLLKVKVNGTCDADTIDGIKAAQEHMREKEPGTVVDGRVSRAHGYDYGGGFWTIATLNRNVRRDFSNVWPRLQDFSDCPASLKTRVAELL